MELANTELMPQVTTNVQEHTPEVGQAQNAGHLQQAEQKSASFSQNQGKAQDLEGQHLQKAHLTASINDAEQGNGEQVREEYSPESYEIKLPEGFQAELHDQSVLERFTHFCSASGVSPEQAQKAVDFYLGEQNSALQGMHAHCETTLRAQWKEHYNSRLATAKRACVSLDREMGGRLMPLINAGLGNDPTFAELMHKVGEKISEDSFGNISGGTAKSEAMSTEEFLRKVVFKGK